MDPNRFEEKTGKSLQRWKVYLDAQNAQNWTHKDIADHLKDLEGVSYWWAQTITVEYEKLIGRRVEGQQSDGTFQLGLRKTLDIPQQELWFLISEDSSLWSDSLGPGDQSRFTTFRDGSHFRMPWKKDTWESHSILQVRVMSGSMEDKSVLSIHQEKLPDLDARTRMKAHWETILDRIIAKIESQ